MSARLQGHLPGLGRIGLLWIEHIKENNRRYYLDLLKDGTLEQTAVEKEERYHETMLRLRTEGDLPPLGAEEIAREELYS